jgi:hypothetical protein
MMWRPTLQEIEAAARVLHEAGLRHHWSEPYRKTHDELAATDAIGKEGVRRHARADADGSQCGR